MRFRTDGKIALVDVMKKHYPGKSWNINYSSTDKSTAEESLAWLDESPGPTEEELQTLIATEQQIFDSVKHQYLRAPEYPSIGDQLDALWKGGEAAEEMLAKVQAVKSKYPKAEGI